MIDKYRLDDLRLESGEKGELARWVIQLQRDLDYERRKVSAPTALSAMDVEPVADVVAWHKEGEERTCDIRWRRLDVSPGPLFAVAQPVAVVPDEMAISDDMNLYQKSFAQGHNACRAAMLNHSENERDMVERVSQPYKLPENSFTNDDLEMMAHGDTPQANAYRELLALRRKSTVIPDGWVACSERLPKEDGNYWGWWSESKRQGPVWFIKSDLQAQFQSSEITHWMPLPAAPQQEGE